MAERDVIERRLSILGAQQQATVMVVGTILGALQGAGVISETLTGSVLTFAGTHLPAESAQEGERLIEAIRVIAESVTPMVRRAGPDESF